MNGTRGGGGELLELRSVSPVSPGGGQDISLGQVTDKGEALKILGQQAEAGRGRNRSLLDSVGAVGRRISNFTRNRGISKSKSKSTQLIAGGDVNQEIIHINTMDTVGESGHGDVEMINIGEDYSSSSSDELAGGGGEAEAADALRRSIALARNENNINNIHISKGKEDGKNINKGQNDKNINGSSDNEVGDGSEVFITGKADYGNGGMVINSDDVINILAGDKSNDNKKNKRVPE